LYDELPCFTPENSVYYYTAKISKINYFESVRIADVNHGPNCSIVVNNVKSDDKGIDNAVGKAG
jgi:hypothetical protein